MHNPSSHACRNVLRNTSVLVKKNAPNAGSRSPRYVALQDIQNIHTFSLYPTHFTIFLLHTFLKLSLTYTPKAFSHILSLTYISKAFSYIYSKSFLSHIVSHIYFKRLLSHTFQKLCLTYISKAFSHIHFKGFLSHTFQRFSLTYISQVLISARDSWKSM
jgi:hypothetical protein